MKTKTKIELRTEFDLWIHDMIENRLNQKVFKEEQDAFFRWILEVSKN
jgi:adenine-specific DNA methylase